MSAIVRCVGWGMLGFWAVVGPGGAAVRSQETPPAAVVEPSPAVTAPAGTPPVGTAPAEGAPADTPAVGTASANPAPAGTASAGTASAVTGEPAMPETSPAVPDGET